MIKIGDIYAMRGTVNDPWNQNFYRVTEIQGKWIRVIFSDHNGFPSFGERDSSHLTKTKFELFLFYKRVGHRNPEQAPWGTPKK